MIAGPRPQPWRGARLWVAGIMPGSAIWGSSARTTSDFGVRRRDFAVPRGGLRRLVFRAAAVGRPDRVDTAGSDPGEGTHPTVGGRQGGNPQLRLLPSRDGRRSWCSSIFWFPRRAAPRWGRVTRRPSSTSPATAGSRWPRPPGSTSRSRAGRAVGPRPAGTWTTSRSCAPSPRMRRHSTTSIADASISWASRRAGSSRIGPRAKIPGRTRGSPSSKADS